MLNIKNSIALAFFAIISNSTTAQHLISDGGTTTTCSGTFFDSGGTSGAYQNNENYVKTFCNPDTSGCISLDFTTFDLENNFDILTIHDGPSVTDPIIYTLSGTNLPTGISSWNSSCITLNFTSDGSVTKTGWQASIACNACPTCSDGIQNGGETGIDCGGSCPPCSGTVCANPKVIPGLPYNFSGTTQDSGDDYSQASVCSSYYMDGEDFVFEYSPSSDTCINIALSGTQNYTGLFILDGCPDDSSSNCLGMDGSPSGNPVLNDLHLFSGTTYYIIVSTWPSPDFTPFTIDITGINCPTCNDGVANGDETGVDCGGSFCPTCPGSTCSDPNVISSLPLNQIGLTTTGSGNEFDENDACLSQFMTGEDYVFTYTPPVDNCVTFRLTGGTWDIGMFLLDNCPDAGGASCLQSATGNNALTINDYPVTGGSIYYLVVSSNASFTPNTNFNMEVTEQACATCFDGIQNGDEQGVDCGGSHCTACLSPPQDCNGSIPICSDIYYQPILLYGEGLIENEINPDNSCFYGGEKNGTWYNFTTQQAGNLCFSVIPDQMTDDFDWALFNLTAASCAEIYSNADLEVACNYSGLAGITGANGLEGSQNTPCVSVNEGEFYSLYVSVFSANAAGYSIDFSTSTTQIYSPINPFFAAASVDSSGTLLTLEISKTINCDSLITHLNDFVILNNIGDTLTSPLIDSISAICEINNTGSTFYFHLSQPLTSGNYELAYTSDAAIFSDNCELEMTQSGARVNFTSNYLTINENKDQFVNGLRSIQGLHPNPASDKLYLNRKILTNYEIYNLSGTLISKGQTSQEIDISRLTPGLYFFHLYTSDYSGQVKITVLK